MQLIFLVLGWLTLAVSYLACPLVYNRAGLSMTARAHSWVTDMHRRRNSCVMRMMVVMMMAVMAVVLAHGNVFLVVIVFL